MQRRDFTKLSFAAIAAMALTAPTAALAEAPILSAPEVQALMDAGDMILIDIRSPEEWAETGVAKGAWPISMHVPGFPQKLQAVLAKYPPQQVAMICATGGRTNYIGQFLEKNGITGVTDLSEGMMGNPRGPGWIARGMPLVSADQAMAFYDAAMGQ